MADDPAARSSALGASTGEAADPFSPTGFRDLAFAPTRFFGAPTGTGVFRLVIAAFLVGLSQAYGRIEQSMVRAELGQPRPGWAAYGPWVTDSWVSFWMLLLLIAAAWAAFAWYVGSWWYRVRLGWSGAEDPTKTRSREVYLYAGLLSAIPTAILLIAYTARFATYQEAWEDPALWPTVVLIFPYWAVIASYRGVRARFAVRTWPARIWFLVLPMLVYTVAFGVLGLLGAISSPATPEP